MNIRMRQLVSLALATLVALALSGCAKSQFPEVTGESSIRGVNAIVDAPEVAFRIEERSLGAIGFKGVTSTDKFDDLSYQFNFDGTLPGDTESTRLASRTLDVVSDMDYVFVLTGSYDNPEVLLWETEERQWEGNEDVAEISAGHLSATLGSVDFYLTAPNDPPVAGEVRGTLSYGDRLDNFDVEAGNYQLVLTPAGDTSTVLFRSVTQTISEQTSVLFAIFEADPSITSAISVRRIGSGGNATELGERNTPPTRRYLHASLDTGNVDVYADEDFTTPLVAGLAYGQVTDDLAVQAGEITYTYTAAGNTGAVLLEDDETIGANSRVTSFLVGPESDPDVIDLVDDRRPVVGTSKVRIVQLAENFDGIDLYLRPAGTDINDVNPTFPNVASPLSTGYSRLAPGDYELTVTETGEKTPLAPVLELDLPAGDIAEVAILDTVDPAAVSTLRYD